MTSSWGTKRRHTLQIVHAVRSDSFAGVERYITNVAPLLVDRDCEVIVIGGDPARMNAALGASNVRYMPAATTKAVARGLQRGGKVDIVHAHMTAAELAAVATVAITRASIIVTRHFAAGHGSSGTARAAAALIRRAVRQEIAISRFVAEGIENEAIVIPNGVAPRTLTSADEPLVVMAQRLEAEKDVEVGLRAWAASGLGADGWRLLIAGGGRLQQNLKGLADELGVSGTVTFAGPLPSLEPLLAWAGIFLATARAEPLGFSVLEAMAFGLPVVASASGGHLETVGRSTNAALFPVGDHHACAQALRRLAADPAARRSYGLELRDVQRREFDLKTHVDQLVDVYTSVADRRLTRSGRC